MSCASGSRHRFRVRARLDDLPFRFKLWLGKAFDLARAIADFAASTLARKKRDLEEQLQRFCSPTGCDLARQLQAKIGRARHQLLTFCDYPGEVDVTNNTSERKLRPCVIQRKITSGYRAMRAAEAEADVRSTVDTARLEGANPFAVIVAILLEPGPTVRRSNCWPACRGASVRRPLLPAALAALASLRPCLHRGHRRPQSV